MKKLKNYNWIIVLSIGILSSVGYLYSKDENPHGVLNKPNNNSGNASCVNCHIESPENAPGEIYTFQKPPIRENITEACSACHEYGERSHPTDIETEMEIPVDLPLFNGRITCATCHYPHGSYTSSERYSASNALTKIGGFFSQKKSYRTYFLRRSNAKGELCLVCHI